VELIQTSSVLFRPEDHRRIRQEAMARLTVRANDGRDPNSTTGLAELTFGVPFSSKTRSTVFGSQLPVGVEHSAERNILS